LKLEKFITERWPYPGEIRHTNERSLRMPFEFWIIIGVIVFIIAIVSNLNQTPEQKKKERDDLARQKKIETYGYISPAMICPHCQTKGHISTKPVKRKKGVSGAKVTGALLTFGVSMLATGLSRKEGLTQAHCGNCDSTWDF
jgi:hypothetical protein